MLKDIVAKQALSSKAQSAGIKFNNTQIVKGFSLFFCLLFFALGLVFIKREILTLIFSDIDLNDTETLVRIYNVQVFFFIAGYVTLFGGWLITRIPGFNTWLERYVGIIVSLAFTVALIVSLEAITATRYEPEYFPKDTNIKAIATGATYLKDDLLGHTLNPGAREYKINSLGFRGEEFPLQKEEDEIRIVALGDSITFGFTVRDEKATYPYYLQQFLQSANSSNNRLSVINAGVPSYDSFQVLRLLENRILDLEPDVIIVMVGWNDLSYGLRPEWRPDISISVGEKPKFSPALFKLVQSLAPQPDLKTVLLSNSPHPEAIEAYRRNLESIITVAEDHHIKVVLTNLPTILSVHGNSAEELKKAELFPKVENLLLFQRMIDEVCASIRFNQYIKNSIIEI